jgi:hypothetical protein
MLRNQFAILLPEAEVGSAMILPCKAEFLFSLGEDTLRL